jgi:hypothetical protein
MAFLSSNRNRDSWAYRSQNGGFGKSSRSNNDSEQSTPTNNNNNSNSNSLGRSATTDTMDALNKTMSQMQFSRPNTSGNYSSASRPSSAGTTRLNNNSDNRRKSGITNANTYNNTHTFGGDCENRAGNTQTLKINPSNATLNPSSSTKTPLSKVPRVVETDKQVLRFFCHFFDTETQVTHRPDLLKVKHPSTARLFSLLVYLNDFTVEIAEEKQANSGLRGGQFYKRNYLQKDDKSDISVSDLMIGGVVSLLGHDFFITDCDAFTRGYFR